MKIAIVGSGIAGLTVAHHLHRDHDITIYEADRHVGGHTQTVDIDVEGRTVPVDMGFIVSNERTYPHFNALLRQLGVPTQPTLMSFSVTDASTGRSYGTHGIRALYSRPRNLIDPRFQRMLIDILRANRKLRALATEDDDDPDTTLVDFVARHHLSAAYVEDFLVPLGSAIWSADPTTFLDQPATTFARFVTNHGMVDLRNRPQWRFVPGGSATYVRALTAPFANRIRTSTAVHSVLRTGDAVEITSGDGPETFDHVVLATHSDQALELLADAAPAEKDILGAIGYQPNEATLHTDDRFLPAHRRVRAAWNAHLGAGDGRAATLTYWMNLLQDLRVETPLLVTLNRDDIDPEKVITRTTFHHPVFDAAAIRAQRRRPQIQGVRRTWFAGAYWGFGFHEDGLVSGLDVVRGIQEAAR